jgi:hypothetical protein
MDMYDCGFEVCGSGKLAFTVCSPRHGECGYPDSRSGYGYPADEAVSDCEWSHLVSDDQITAAIAVCN